MAQGKASTEWFVKDDAGMRGPFSETELRQLVQRSSDPRLQVKQGNSSWHPAAVIRQKIDQLAARGIYVRCGRVAEGPFTITKARELLGTVSNDGIRVRTGQQGEWVPASQWLAAIRRLERKQKRKTQSPTPMTTRSPAGNDGVLEAVAVDEITDAVVVEPVVVQAIPVAIPVNPGYGLPPSQPTLPAPRTPTPFVSTPVQASTSRAASPYANSHTQGNRGRGSMLLKVGTVAVSVFMVVGIVGLKALKVGGKAALRQQRSDGQAQHQRQDFGPGHSRTVIASSPSGPSDLQDSLPPSITESPGSKSSGPAPSASARPQRSGPPTVRSGMLFRPQFVTLDGIVDAGTAFAARIEGQRPTYIVSALHLFGEAGGLQRDIPALVLSSRWQGLSLEDCQSRVVHSDVPMKPIPLTMAKPLPNRSKYGDVAVCEIHDADRLKLQAIPMAREVPAPKDRVWLVSEVIGSASLVHPATVEGTEDGWLLYRFDRSIELRATSGAPVVDDKGQVVAVNAGGGEQDGATYGVGTPTANFAAALANRR